MNPWLILSIAFSVWAFSPILGAYFHNDDFIHLFHIVDLGFLRFLVEPFAMHSLVVRNAIMYGAYQWFGPDPRASFALVLLTHALNTGLFFAAVRAFTGSALIACFGATLWGTAPILGGSLGWYTVYGHVLVGTCLLAILALLAPAGGGRSPGASKLAAAALLAVAASACFGTGLGVAATFPLLVWTLAPAARPHRFALPLSLLAPLVAAAAYFAVGWWQPLGDLADSAGAFGELIRSARPRPVLLLSFHLLRYGAAELLFGWINGALPRSEAAASVALAIWGAAIIAASMFARPPMRRLACVLPVVALACYATIALAKGNLAVSMLRDVRILAREARYHYAPLVPLAVILCLGVAAIVERWPRSRGIGRILLMAWIAARVAAHVVHPRPPEMHAEERQTVAALLAEIGEHVRAASPGETVVMPDRRFPPVHPYLDVGSAALFLIHHPTGALDDRRIRFAVPEQTLRQAEERGERVAEFLVAR